MSQALYRKWRPQNWETVAGQQHVISTLRNALSAGRIAHAYLFAGPRGTGKTTTARLLAKAANCLNPDLSLRPCGDCEHCQTLSHGRFIDLIEIDAASNTSVEDVRDLRDKINFSPNLGHYKVYIIDEVHMLSTAAFNALLKTLEEPPPHAIFILATTEVHKIPATVLSRCQRHEFRRISVVEIVDYLSEIAQNEGIKVEPEALTLIARQSTGSMRDAISLLDQLASSDQPITLKTTQDVLGTAASQVVLEVIDALITGKADTGLELIQSALDGGSDPRQFARQVVDYVRSLLIIRFESTIQIDATREMHAQMTNHAQAFNVPELLKIIRAFNRAASDARNTWHPSLPLEIALLESMEKSDTEEKIPPTDPIYHTPISESEIAHTKPSPRRQSKEESALEKTGEDDSVDRQATQTLSESWSQLLVVVREQNPRAYGLLNSCKSRYMRGDTLILFFSSDVLKDQMERPENLEISCQALHQIFQRDISIQCNVDITKRDKVPPGVDENGMIAAALRDLGGEIVDV